MTQPKVYFRRPGRQTMGDSSRWTELVLVRRRNDVSRWTLTTSDPEDAASLSPILDTSGRIIERRGVVIRKGDLTLASGWCETEPRQDSDGTKRMWTFSGWDDTVLMADALCLPKPSAPITAQTDAYHVTSGHRSDRIRTYFTANVVTRLGIPGTNGGVPLALGQTGVSRARMRSVLEVSQEIAGRQVNFRVIQRASDRALFLEQWAPRDLRRRVQFTPVNETVKGWSYVPSPGDGTRAIVGAADAKSARPFRSYVDVDAEAEWGGLRKIERFLDRGDLDPEENPTWEDEAEQDALDFLAEGRARASFTVDITGGPDYGTAWDVGDLVRAYIDVDANGRPIGVVDDVIEQATVTWNEQGEHAQVSIGTEDSPQLRTARDVRALRRRIGKLEAR